VNIFAKNKFEEEIFYVFFYPLLLLALFIFFIIFFFGSSPAVLVGLDPISPAWLPAQASNQPKKLVHVWTAQCEGN
jgi:hypothetical protein